MTWYEPWTWDLSTDADKSNQQNAKSLQQVGTNALGYGNSLAANTTQDTAALNQQRQYLQGVQSGANSVSAEQLRQALQQQLAQQRSFAASASPANSAMASRNAAMNMGQASYGMAGQQATAGLQERNDAAQQLANLNLGARGQDISGTTGAYGTANQSFGQPAQQGAAVQIGMGAVGGFAGGLGHAISDRRAKKDVSAGDLAAMSATKKVAPKTFDYKNPARDGKGRQLGVMAQDLEKNPQLKHVVVNTPFGKAIHGGKLATANTAMIAALGKRVEKLEGRGRKAA
ncbi:MAG TPA: tail fiber domain-containing protein [Kofleriaceae bacterium]|jgi:hypothetical protein